MEMTILERDDGITHVALAGRLDTNAADQLEKRFTEATGAQNRPAIVDLSQVDFVASRGIGLLIANSKRLQKARHKLVVLNPQAIVAGVLKTSKADMLMPIVRDIAEAIHVLRGGPTDSASASARAAVVVRESPVQPQQPVSAALPRRTYLSLASRTHCQSWKC